MSRSRLYINISSETPSAAFVRSFTDGGQANPLVIARSDSFDLELHFLAVNPIPTPNRPFVYVDPATWSGAKFAMGSIGAVPNGGTFTLTSSLGGSATSALAYTATAAAVQAALRAIGVGGGLTACTVTGSDGGPYRVDSNDTANGTLALTGNAAALAPDGSTVVIVKTQTANGSLTNRWSISLAKALPVLNTTWAALPSASVAVTTVQAGSSTANKTFRVVWNEDAYFGGVLLSFYDGSATWTLGPIAYNAQATDVAAAFTATGANNAVTVVQNNLGDFTIACTGSAIQKSNNPNLITSSNTLIVPVGYIGTVTASTSGVDDILNGATSASTYCEVEIRQIAGEPQTVAQINNAVFIADLITNSPGYATGTEDFATIGDVENISEHIFADDAARIADTPYREAQFGWQLDNGTWWFAGSTVAGDWSSIFTAGVVAAGRAGAIPGEVWIWNQAETFKVSLTVGTVTADRTITYPDESGTVALLGGGGVILPSKGGTGIANNNASTITISGNFATTLTVTGATGVTLPTTGTLATLAGSENLTNKSLTSATITTGLTPTTDDGAALGTTSLNFSDLFLASGAVINYNNGNVVVTHTSGILTMGTGDFRVTTAGTNTASVVTVGGAQTLTSKTLTSPVITNIAPGANFTLTQNSVAAITSVNSGAVVNTLYLNAGLVGINTASGTAQLDVSGVIRSTGVTGLPTSGTGVEILYNGSAGFIQTYNRTGSAYGPLTIDATSLSLNTTSSGTVTVGSGGTAILRAKHGTVVLASGTKTTSDATISANARIIVTRFTDGGTIGCSYSITRSAGANWTVTSKDSAGATQTGDTSTLSYIIIEP